jgi:hypothetical protein
MLLDPLKADDTYNATDFIFIQNFNYLMGSHLTITIGNLGDD